jgi:hypothetical protein
VVRGPGSVLATHKINGAIGDRGPRTSARFERCGEDRMSILACWKVNCHNGILAQPANLYRKARRTLFNLALSAFKYAFPNLTLPS